MESPSASVIAEAPPEGRRFAHATAVYAPVLSVAVVLVALLVVFGLTTESFLTSRNLLNVLAQSAPLLVLAAGATLVISAGGIDLSVGSLTSLCTALIAVLLAKGVGVVATLLLVLLAGLALGIVQGYLAAYQDVPSFIVTLGGLSIFLGTAQLISGGESKQVKAPEWFMDLGGGHLGDLPVATLIAAAVLGLTWIVLHATAYGRHLQGIGSNEEAVRRAGIDTRRALTLVFGLSGLAAAIASVLLATRLQVGSSQTATGLELQAVAAVVLGGTNLFGGRAFVLGTVLGVLTVAFINNGLLLRSVDPFYVSMVQGGLLVLAVWGNTKLRKRWG